MQPSARSLRVACVMMQRDEYSLLDPWLRYHSHLFGPSSLYVLDNGSTDPLVRETLARHAAIGVNVDYRHSSAADFERKSNLVMEVFDHLGKSERYDFIFPLDCDEFVGALTVQGEPAFSAEAISSALAEHLHDPRVLMISSAFDNIPGDAGFIPSPSQRKCFFASGVAKHLGIGFHAGVSRSPGAETAKTRLIYVHFHNKPFNEYRLGAYRKLVNRVADFLPATLREHISAQGLGFHVASAFLMTEEQYSARFRSAKRVNLPGFHEALARAGAEITFNICPDIASVLGSIDGSVDEAIVIDGQLSVRGRAPHVGQFRLRIGSSPISDFKIIRDDSEAFQLVAAFQPSHGSAGAPVSVAVGPLDGDIWVPLRSTKLTIAQTATYPPEFDPGYYRARYKDLSAMGEQRLRAHYFAHGRREGRAASSAARRREFLPLIPDRVLEIGPSHRPSLIGPEVRYFDVLSAEDNATRHKLASPGPAIHYVEPSGDLSVVDQVFDAVFSSHCIEHQPDLVRHLNGVSRLLSPGGAYFLMVPDKRFCFDHFIAESSLAQVVLAHSESRQRHTLASVIEHRALTTHNDSRRHWAGDHADPDYLDRISSRTQKAIAEFERAAGRYIDVHAWQFTPASFRTLLTQLYELGLSPLKPIRVYDTPHGSNEFAAILAVGERVGMREKTMREKVPALIASLERLKADDIWPHAALYEVQDLLYALERSRAASVDRGEAASIGEAIEELKVAASPWLDFTEAS